MEVCPQITTSLFYHLFNRIKQPILSTCIQPCVLHKNLNKKDNIHCLITSDDLACSTCIVSVKVEIFARVMFRTSAIFDIFACF